MLFRSDRTEVRVRRGNQDTRRPRAEASGGTSPAGTLISGFWPRELKGSSVLLLKPQAAWAVCHGSAGGPVNLVVQGGRPLPAAVAGHLPWVLGDIRTEILTSPHPCSRRLSSLLRQPCHVTCKIYILSFLSAALTWVSFSFPSPFQEVW